MVNHHAPHISHIDLVFQAFSDPTRRRILERLTTADVTISELAKPHAMSLPAISKHLRVLEKAALITKKKQGRTYVVSIKPQTIQKISDYLSYYTKFWNKQLDNLEQYLKKK